jgi:hypothetical protein
MAVMGFTFKATLPDGLKKYQQLVAMDKTGGVDFHAKSQVALQFLNWSNQGSANDSTVPPIKTGNLRGSASVFVGKVLIQDTRGQYGKGTPVKTNNDPMSFITIIYNTSYAAKMHEDTWLPGGRNPSKKQMAENLANSAKFGDVGNKWLEKHMTADGKDLLEMYAMLLKKGTGA